jgi:hypothetical protein
MQIYKSSSGFLVYPPFSPGSILRKRRGLLHGPLVSFQFLLSCLYQVGHSRGHKGPPFSLYMFNASGHIDTTHTLLRPSSDSRVTFFFVPYH